MENDEQQQKPAELSIVDLQNIRTLIDVAVRRGTFSAAELSGVGAVYDRLNNFLNSITAQPTEETPSEPDPVGEPTISASN